MKIFLHIIFLLLCFGTAKAQQDSVESAIQHLQAGNLQLAKRAIDATEKDVALNSEARTHHYKGYIYKELSKNASGNEALSFRETAVNEIKKSIELDKQNEFVDDNRKILKYLGTLYYNESVKNLNEEKFAKAPLLFYNYISIMKFLDPAFDAKSKTIEFNLAQGTFFTQLYNSDWKSKEAFLPKAQEAYLAILTLDSNNYTANYNLGLLFYNHAVHIIKDMPYETDLITLNEISDKTSILFKKAEPYGLKAHSLYPNRLETLTMLQGIYFSLNDFDKSNYYKDLADKLKN